MTTCQYRMGNFSRRPLPSADFLPEPSRFVSLLQSAVTKSTNAQRRWRPFPPPLSHASANIRSKETTLDLALAVGRVPTNLTTNPDPHVLDLLEAQVRRPQYLKCSTHRRCSDD